MGLKKEPLGDRKKLQDEKSLKIANIFFGKR